MQQASLRCHSTTPSIAIQAIEIELLRPTAQNLVLRYRLHGDIAALRMPAARAPQRADGLWRHTCCELFIGSTASDAYCEFNFSPSTEWAAYRFQSYRRAMQPPIQAAPDIRVQHTAHALSLQASLQLADVPIDDRSVLALAAVIEETDGRLSYWALKHPASQPDFHHRDGFVLKLSG